MATVAPVSTATPVFYRRMAVGLSLFIVFGFAQFAARGFVDYRSVPPIFHVHGIVMVTWLSLFAIQANLPSRGAIRLHQTLGMAGVMLVPVITALAIATCVTALKLGVFPPFFTKGFFLALVSVEASTFAVLVLWAVHWRSRPKWHRRLMLGATAILLEPALGRILPIPLLGGMADWVAMVLQLLVPLAMALNDRRDLGNVHPATAVSALAIIFTHTLVALMANAPAWNAFANGIAG